MSPRTEPTVNEMSSRDRLRPTWTERAARPAHGLTSSRASALAGRRRPPRVLAPARNTLQWCCRLLHPAGGWDGDDVTDAR